GRLEGKGVASAGRDRTRSSRSISQTYRGRERQGGRIECKGDRLAGGDRTRRLKSIRSNACKGTPVAPARVTDLPRKSRARCKSQSQRDNLEHRAFNR